ncbi:Hypothetical predicted protein [Mytilus galloprovincialis]|uniref:Uncharacterized protein n=1 Tax=Mytilus galloprovincialis TaxID=29158 RepID=A0A8B6F972_MYTGA|nr:Hypothetical predicted protein [Mytilus galloprovincialis]
MLVQHRPGKKHVNADALSRIPDTLNECNSYLPSIPLNNLPCGGCKYCTRARNQWSTFEEEVDFVKPQTVRAVSIKDVTSTKEKILQPYTENELRDAQKNDIDLSTVIAWLSTDFSPSKQDLQMSSPLVERYNRIITQLIRCFLKKTQNRWDIHLQQLAGAIRATENRQTGFYTEFHGFRTRGDIVLKLDTARKVGISPKLKAPWKGPYVVIEVKSPALLKIKDRKREEVVHHDRLKLCIDREIHLWLQRLRNDILGRAENKLERDTNMELEDLYLDILFSGENQNTQNDLNSLSESLTDDFDNNDPFLVSDSLTNNSNNEQDNS